MFANDKNIDNLQQLLAELKKYAELQKDYVKLHLVEKLTILISTLILVFILLILGIIALFYLSFTLAYVLAPHVGGLMASYGIITGCIILLILLIVLFRKRHISLVLFDRLQGCACSETYKAHLQYQYI